MCKNVSMFLVSSVLKGMNELYQSPDHFFSLTYMHTYTCVYCIHLEDALYFMKYLVLIVFFLNRLNLQVKFNRILEKYECVLSTSEAFYVLQRHGESGNLI